jgi:hypothetical protein
VVVVVVINPCFTYRSNQTYILLSMVLFIENCKQYTILFSLKCIFETIFDNPNI